MLSGVGVGPVTLWLERARAAGTVAITRGRGPGGRAYFARQAHWARLEMATCPDLMSIHHPDVCWLQHSEHQCRRLLESHRPDHVGRALSTTPPLNRLAEPRPVPGGSAAPRLRGTVQCHVAPLNSRCAGAGATGHVT